MVRHGPTEIGFISRTGSTHSRGLRRMVRLCRTKCQVGFIRVAPTEPGKIGQDSLGLARRGVTHKTGLRIYNLRQNTLEQRKA